MVSSTKIALGSLTIAMIMIGCGSSSTTTNDSPDTKQDNLNKQTRFVSMTINNDIVMQDTQTKLEWANGPAGCNPMTPGKSAIEAFNISENHCSMMSFASHEDWRVPTIGEIQKFTVDMNTSGLKPYYQNPACPRVVGYNDDNTTLQNTNTHNTPPIGIVTDWTNLNAGVRCVRNIL